MKGLFAFEEYIATRIGKITFGGMFLTMFVLVLAIFRQSQNFQALRQVQSHQLERAYDCGFTTADMLRYRDRQVESYDSNLVVIKKQALSMVADTTLLDFDLTERVRSFAYSVFNSDKKVVVKNCEFRKCQPVYKGGR